MNEPSPSVYVIGDSISIQYGPHLRRMLEGTIRYARKEGEAEALLNLDHPRGANGGDSSMVLAFMTALAERGERLGDLLLVNCGLHDIKTDVDTGAVAVEPDAYRANLHAIVDRSVKLADGMAWLRTTAVHDDRHRKRGAGFNRVDADCQRYNAIADAVMAERGVPTIDLRTFTAALDTEGADSIDGVHFPEPVQRQQAAFIAGWLAHWAARR